MSIGEAGRHPLAPGDTDLLATGDVVVIEGLAAPDPTEGVHAVATITNNAAALPHAARLRAPP